MNVVKAVLIVAVVVILLLVAIWSVQRRLIYFPSTETLPPAGSVVPGAQDVVLQTSDGLKLGAWFVPAAGADRGVTVLVANGNAGDRSGRGPLARALSARGLSVLLFDYRGYGGNPGSPSEDGLARDVRAAHRYLAQDAGVDPDRLLYFGESLGAAVVTELATEHPPGGLVLRSPFVDLSSVGRSHYPFLPVGTLLRDRYPLRDHLMNVHVPTVVVYGTADSVVPADQSREVARSAPRLRELVAVQGADHNDPVLLDGRTLVEAVVGLADQMHEPS